MFKVFQLKKFLSFEIIFCQQNSCPKLTVGNADRERTMALRTNLFFPDFGTTAIVINDYNLYYQSKRKVKFLWNFP